MLDAATYRNIEGAVENQFCDDEGEITASKAAQEIFLETEGFSAAEIEEYFKMNDM